MKKHRVLIVKPNTEPYVAMIENTLESEEAIVVGRTAEIRSLDKDIVVICNESGALTELKNRDLVVNNLPMGHIYGTFIISGVKNSKCRSLSRKQIKKYQQQFSLCG